MGHDKPPMDTWRWAGKIAALWVAVVGTGSFALSVAMAMSDHFQVVYYVINFALLALALSLPLAVGQWYQSWKVAWLTLAFEVCYSVLAMMVLLIRYATHFQHR